MFVFERVSPAFVTYTTGLSTIGQTFSYAPQPMHREGSTWALLPPPVARRQLVRRAFRSRQSCRDSRAPPGRHALELPLIRLRNVCRAAARSVAAALAAAACHAQQSPSCPPSQPPAPIVAQAPPEPAPATQCPCASASEAPAPPSTKPRFDSTKVFKLGEQGSVTSYQMRVDQRCERCGGRLKLGRAGERLAWAFRSS